MTKEELYAFMVRSRLAVLATSGPDGEAQSALMGIAVMDDLEIVFDTVTSSRKYPNLKSNPQCRVVIGWEGERTVQLEGLARELCGPELDRFKEVYFRVWPDGVTRQSWPRIAYFLVRSTWIRFSDFDLDPPRIEEWIPTGR